MPQAGMISIRSVEDLIAFMALVGDDERFWPHINLDDFSLIMSVAAGGEYRDGRIGPAGATFILDLQRSTALAFKRYGRCRMDSWLRVRVADGSDDKQIDFTEIGKEGIKKMTPAQITACFLLAIGLFGGYHIYGQVRDADLAAMKLQLEATMRQRADLHDENMIQRMSEYNTALGRLWGNANSLRDGEAAAGRDAQKPIRKFIISLDEDETISINQGRRYNKREALELLGALPDQVMHYVHGDGVYILQRIELLNNRQVIGVVQDGHGKLVTAILSRLEPELQQRLLQTVKESMERNTQQEMSLQIDIYFTAKGIQHAALIGVGEPRPGMRHYRLQDIPNEVDPRDARLPGE
jgi:hypothetical protein